MTAPRPSPRVSFMLESAFGSVKPAGSPTDFDSAIRAAKDDKALRTTGA